MEPEELKDLIREAVSDSIANGDVLGREELRELMHDAVVEAMSTLGIDARNPMDVQRDMQFVRELRLMSESVKKKTLLTMVGLLVAALLGVAWLGVKSLLS
jgi:hypothetical protein